jgi:hypothetical protein
MTESASIGALTTQFVGDISGIRNAVQEVKGILKAAQSEIGNIRFNVPVGNIKSSLGKSVSSGIKSAVGEGFSKASISKEVISRFTSNINSSIKKNLKGIYIPPPFGFTHTASTSGQSNFKFRQAPPPAWKDTLPAMGRGGQLARTGGPIVPYAGRAFTPQMPEIPEFNFKALSGALDDLSGSLLKLGAGLTGLVSRPLAMFSKSAVMTASEQVEWQNVFDQSFNKVLPQARKSVKAFADEFALSSKTANFLLGDIGELAGGIGFTQEKSLELAMAINKLSGDLTSFRNLKGGIQATTHALFMGLMGNSRSLKRLGIAINQQMPEFRKLTNEIMRTNGYTWQQARFLAVLQTAMKQTAFAVGDYQRTQHTFANALRRVEERMISLKVAFGKLLIEGLGLNHILSGLARVISGLAKGIELLPWPLKMVVGLITVAGIAIGPLVIAIGLLGFAITSTMRGVMAWKTIGPPIGHLIDLLILKIRVANLALIHTNFSLKLILAKMKAIVVFIFARLIPAIAMMTAKLMLNPLVLAAAGAVLAIKYAYDELSNVKPIKPKLDLSEMKGRGGAVSKPTTIFGEFKENVKGLGSYLSDELSVFWKDVKMNSMLIASGAGDAFNMFTKHSRESLASGLVLGKESPIETFRKYFLEVADIWSPEKSGKRMAEQIAQWQGIDMKNIGEPVLSDKKTKGLPSATLDIPKLASAALVGTAEGVAAMNRPTKADGMLAKADTQIALLQQIRDSFNNGVFTERETLGLV